MSREGLLSSGTLVASFFTFPCLLLHLFPFLTCLSTPQTLPCLTLTGDGSHPFFREGLLHQHFLGAL
jgi:hypothetical protein